ncbi:unnamed protein product [Periconia digitata]|uniref:Uncharacterized protein n=1 Tax=Periconia digitata TaxID=1303443 RepID=A0A9W4XRN1_9PLEO|nr:unnamed protein product [Periconia digitata]
MWNYPTILSGVVSFLPTLLLHTTLLFTRLTFFPSCQPRPHSAPVILIFHFLSFARTGRFLKDMYDVAAQQCYARQGSRELSIKVGINSGVVSPCLLLIPPRLCKSRDTYDEP